MVLVVALLSTTTLATQTAGEVPASFVVSDLQARLPQNSVYDVLQDRDGLLWFGTREGVARWDGHELRTWRVGSEPADLPGNLITRIMQDADGNIWVHAHEADRLPAIVARISAPDYNVVVPYEKIADAALAQDADGVLWAIQSDRLLRYAADIDQFALEQRFAQELPARVDSAVRLRDGTFVLALASGDIFQFDTNKTEPRLVAFASSFPVPKQNIHTALFEDDAGLVWILVQGVWVWRRDEAVIQPADNPVLHEVDAWDIVQDGRGDFWVAGMGGVYRFGPEQRLQKSFLRTEASEQWALSLMIDQTGVVWVGSLWGLWHFDPSQTRFGLRRALAPGSGQELGSIAAVHVGADGALWVGTFGQGLLWYKDDDVAHHPLSGSAQSRWVWWINDLAFGEVAIGTSYGLDRVAAGQDRQLALRSLWRRSNPEQPAVVAGQALAIDDFFVVDAGVLRVNRYGRLLTYPHPAITETEELVVDQDVIWVATPAGLLKFDLSDLTWRHYTVADGLTQNSVVTVHRDAIGQLWVGTGSGLHRLDLNADRFERISLKAAGLRSEFINCVVNDRRGGLWFSTNREIGHIPDPRDPAVARVFGAAAGIGNSEFNRRACSAGGDGRLYFGGDQGVTEFSAREVRANAEDVAVAFSSAVITRNDGTSRKVGRGELQLEPSDQTIRIRFTATSFANAAAPRYEAQLAGLEAEWVSLGSRAEIAYTNLDPGEYMLRVRTENPSGIASPHEMVVPLTVAPALTETLWFRALATVVAIGLVAVVVAGYLRWRFERTVAVMRAEQLVAEERARIARDMHDEVGAGLTEITLLSELARRDTEQSSAMAGDIAARARALTEALGDIIWALEPGNDQLSRFLPHLREYVGRICNAAALELDLDFPTLERLPDRELVGDLRRGILLILKEALSNAVRHADATKLTVQCKLDDKNLWLVVEDNGRGVPGVPVPGNGLVNMSTRAQDIGGTVSVSAALGGGTQVRLIVNLPNVERLTH